MAIFGDLQGYVFVVCFWVCDCLPAVLFGQVVVGCCSWLLVCDSRLLASVGWVGLGVWRLFLECLLPRDRCVL